MFHRLLGQLNFNHLFYFWVVARQGSVVAATRQLHLTQPTVSGQLRKLEAVLGTPLFARRGRGLVLTDTGQLVLRYADAIFAGAGELAAALDGQPVGRPARFAVGLSDALPKLTATRLLEPALATPEALQLQCRSDKSDRLLAALAIHELDLVLSDAPVPEGLALRLFAHPLGECGVTVFGVRPLARRFRRRFPHSLNGAPFILPMAGSALRRGLDTFFRAQALRPAVAAEVEDAALLQALGTQGLGLFAAPSVVEAEVVRAYRVVPLGRLPQVRARFFAISAERKLQHPAVLAILAAAEHELFH